MATLKRDVFDSALELLRDGGFGPIGVAVELAMQMSHATTALIVAVSEDKIKFLLLRGMSYPVLRKPIEKSKLGDIIDSLSAPFRIDDIFMLPDVEQKRIRDTNKSLRFIAGAPIPIDVDGLTIALICTSNDTKIVRPPDLMDNMNKMAQIIADVFNLVSDITPQLPNISQGQIAIDQIASALNTASGVIALIDSDMIVRAMSPACARIVDIPVEDQIGKSISDLYYYHVSNFGFIDYIKNRIKNDTPDNGYVVNWLKDTLLEFHTIRLHDNISKEIYLIVDCKTILEPPNISRVMEVKDADEDHCVTTRFLLETIIKHRRMLSRKATSYHAVNRWRRPIQDYQIKALRALKAVSPKGFIAAAAEQLAQTALSLFGRGSFMTVSHVPCGCSGPGCMASKLAREVAAQLGLEYSELFEPLNMDGSSHPIRNAKRPAMKLRGSKDHPVLLIDDVATSGAHIEEAVGLLRSQGIVAFPLVWIAP